MASSGSKKYHWTDVQLYALGLAQQNASNQEKTTDVQLGMEIANTYKQHLQRALADMLVSWDDVHAYSMDELVLVRTALAPVTLWNKFKDKGKCLTAHYNTWSLSSCGSRAELCRAVPRRECEEGLCKEGVCVCDRKTVPSQRRVMWSWCEYVASTWRGECDHCDSQR